MSEELRKYQAIIFGFEPDQPGIRRTYSAKNLDEAREQLEQEFGKDKVFTLYNAEDAAKIR